MSPTLAGPQETDFCHNCKILQSRRQGLARLLNTWRLDTLGLAIQVHQLLGSPREKCVMKRSAAIALALLLVFAALPCFADGFNIGTASNFAILYEGNGGHTADHQRHAVWKYWGGEYGTHDG